MENQRKFTALQVAQIVQEHGYCTRSAIARLAGRKKTRHVINVIEQAVDLGYVYRVIGNDGIRDAYFYTVEEPAF